MQKQTKHAVKVLKEGGIILYPTEGVYGLGCDPFNETAVLRLLKIKKRNINKGLILAVASWKQAMSLLKLDPTKRNIVKQKKGEPVTWVIPATKKTPPWITGKFSSVAIRLIAHPMAKDICQKFGGPIVSTSANLSNSKPIKTLSQIDHGIIDDVDFIVSGKVGDLGRPTKICDIKTGKIVRV